MQDILYTNNLSIKNGDLQVGESTNQHIQHILISNKGEWKRNPEIGVGISNMLNSEEAIDFLIEAKKNLEYDGMLVNNIAFTETESLNIDAKYK